MTPPAGAGWDSTKHFSNADAGKHHKANKDQSVNRSEFTVPPLCASSARLHSKAVGSRTGLCKVFYTAPIFCLS